MSASPLRASRRVSLGFRIRFVFSVCHGFLLCGVTIFDPCPIDVLNPLRTGRAPLTHPAPHQHRHAKACCEAVEKRSVFRRSVRRTSRWSACWLGRVPCTDITRFRSTRLFVEFQRYYASFGLPECHLPPSPFQILGHTRLLIIGIHDSGKNLRVSLVTLMT